LIRLAFRLGNKWTLATRRATGVLSTLDTLRQPQVVDECVYGSCIPRVVFSTVPEGVPDSPWKPGPSLPPTVYWLRDSGSP